MPGWINCDHRHVSINCEQADVRPSCWDGIEVADGDYTAHVQYPIDAPNGHVCPLDYPRKLMTVQFETNFDVGPFGYHGNGTWVLANGDTTGVSLSHVPQLMAVRNTCRLCKRLETRDPRTNH